MNMNYSQLENSIGYEFKNKELLINALTHTSYSNEHKNKDMKDNERLEFLGDAVLELVTSEFLYIYMKDMPEGQMSKLRASLVCEPTLAIDAKNFGLENYIYLGKGEDETGGRKRDSIISDAFEALIGAIFLDSGIEAAKAFVYKFALDDIENKRMFHDSKTILQERLNAVKNGNLSYEIINETGPDHDKCYEAVAKFEDKIIGQGKGRTKKAAEQQAAYQALKTLDKRN